MLAIWKPIDDVYGPLKVRLWSIEDAYAKRFGRRRGLTEMVIRVGEKLYDELKIVEPDTYNWGRDDYRHFAGMRFAINFMRRMLGAEVKVEYGRRFDGAITFKRRLNPLGLSWLKGSVKDELVLECDRFWRYFIRSYALPTRFEGEAELDPYELLWVVRVREHYT